jgi:hypothetical protein
MSNVLSGAKKQQIIAPGRLGWPLRRIEQETGVRRETAGAYLKAAGIGVRPPGAWGRRPPVKPANEDGVTPGSDAAKPASTVNPNPENLSPKGKAKARTAKPANENAVTTGFGAELSDSEQESPSDRSVHQFVRTVLVRRSLAREAFDGLIAAVEPALGHQILPNPHGICDPGSDRARFAETNPRSREP